MNDAASSSDHPRPNITDSQDESVAPASDEAGRIVQKRRAQQQQKAAFLDHLINDVDVVFYAQLSVLYYMDCSFPKFILRALPHWFYFTPKASIFPPPPLTPRPYIAVILGPNIISALLHLFLAPPAAGEVTRGYLHGGLLTDFVGQKSPVGRWRLVGLDILVLLLQILMLGITLEKKAVKYEGEAVATVREVVAEAGQDHDAEERGMLRRNLDYREDIELQDLHHASSGRTGGDEDRERDELLAADTGTDQAEQHPLDPYYTGEQVIASLHILDTIRAQWQAGAVALSASGASAASGVQAAAVAAAAGRTLTYRSGDGMQSDP